MTCDLMQVYYATCTGLSNMNIICIEANNSVEFVNTVFDCYQKNIVFAITHSPSLAQFIESTGLQASTYISTTHDKNWLVSLNSPLDGDFPAQIVFTSGTEGRPKAIVLSHTNLKNVVDRINLEMEVDDSIREYVGIPVYHSFGLGRCRAVSAAGGRAFIPKRGFDINEIKKMLERNEINAISAVPSLWRVLLDNSMLSMMLQIGLNG